MVRPLLESVIEARHDDRAFADALEDCAAAGLDPLHVRVMVEVITREPSEVMDIFEGVTRLLREVDADARIDVLSCERVPVRRRVLSQR